MPRSCPCFLLFPSVSLRSLISLVLCCSQGIGAAMAPCAHTRAQGKPSHRSSPPRADDRRNHRCPPREQAHVHPRAPLMVRRSSSLASLRRRHRRQQQLPWRHRPCSPPARSAAPSADLLPQAPFPPDPYLALPRPATRRARPPLLRCRQPPA